LVAAATAEAPPKLGRVVIQPGNNLWRISQVIYGSGVKYTVIYEANKDHIRNPDLIYPGQIFATPEVVPPEKIDPRRRAPLAPGESEAPAQ
jgi:nucleoid-associated protein YgaU